MNLQHIAMLGCGELGKSFATHLLSSVSDVRLWDLKSDLQISAHMACRTLAVAREASAHHGLRHCRHATVLGGSGARGRLQGSRNGCALP